MRVAPPAPRETDRTETPRAGAARSDSTGLGQLDGWACGLGQTDDQNASGRCRDISPELIIELL